MYTNKVYIHLVRETRGWQQVLEAAVRQRCDEALKESYRAWDSEWLMLVNMVMCHGSERVRQFIHFV